jgi:hypothetical protein
MPIRPDLETHGGIKCELTGEVRARLAADVEHTTLLSCALTSLSLAVLVLDHDHTVLTANEAASDLLGITSTSLAGPSMTPRDLDIRILRAEEKSRGHPRAWCIAGLQVRQCPGRSPPGRQLQVVLGAPVMMSAGVLSTTGLPREDTQCAEAVMSPFTTPDGQTYFTLIFTSIPDIAIGSHCLDTSETASPSPDAATVVGSLRHVGPVLTSNQELSAPLLHRGHQGASGTDTSYKIDMLKDAMLNRINSPMISVWRDGSVAFINQGLYSIIPGGYHTTPLMQCSAARHLDTVSYKPEAGPVISPVSLPEWNLWTENFSRQLQHDEHPFFRVLATQTAFANVKAGYQSKDGKRTVIKFAGKDVRDSATGEFVAGIITAHLVTSATEGVFQSQEPEEDGFKMICDYMPQLVSHHAFLV